MEALLEVQKKSEVDPNWVAVPLLAAEERSGISRCAMMRTTF
jgi:hypothetical protein